MADDPTDPATEPEATDGDPTEGADVDGAAAEATADAPVGETDVATPAAKAGTTTAAAAKGEAAAAGPKVVRKKVVSKRVTPKGGTQGVKATGPKGATAARSSAKATGDDEDLGFSKRYTPPAAKYAPGPSPWWVPALMFGLFIVGALVIMLNYMGAFGDAENIRLVIGLAFILGGIVTATQYR